VPYKGREGINLMRSPWKKMEALKPSYLKRENLRRQESKCVVRF